MKKQVRQGILTKIARLRRDQRGISAIEFAFVFPIMVILYLGATALTQGIVIKRKVTLATRTVGDLVSQYTTIANSDIQSILTAATTVIQPYSTSLIAIVVSSISIDANGNATVAWSQATSNTTALTKNSSVTLPAGIGGTANANTTIIWAQGSYVYTLPVGSTIVGHTSMTLSDQFYLRPRRVTSVACTATGC
ncbi:MAG TPA: TadE/TadG family type IV pilus assembly protein [Xanthobacteraceae bacterium]|nr:TadE/TadG family type IV pilus assembly protein [Xanthobacteraceae bacterium]